MSVQQFGGLVVPNRKPARAFPRTFAEAAARYKKRRRERITLARNTWLGRWQNGEAYSVTLHQTEIVTFYSNGDVQLTTGGWQTQTTRARLSACGFNVSCAGGVASIYWRGRHYAWRDGLTVNPRTGKIRGPKGEKLPRAEECRIARRRALARDRRRGEWNVPRLGTRQFSEWIPGGNTAQAR